MTLEKLNELRKTYSKLRSFFLKGDWKSGRIPSYCYDNYIECFQLIYQYIEQYTPKKFLDVAFFDLDNSYTLYSYIMIYYRGAKEFLNYHTMPFKLQQYQEYYCTQCLNALGKIYLYILNDVTYDKKLTEELFITGLSKKIKDNSYYLFMPEESHGMPFKGISSMMDIISLDGLILCNTLWNNYKMVSQSRILKVFLEKANRINEDFGQLQLSFELIGIKFDREENKIIYNQIIQEIKSASRDKEEEKKILLNHLLKMIFKEKNIIK